MKALRRSSTSSASSAGPTSSPPRQPDATSSSPPTGSSAWVHLRSLLVVASSSSASASSSNSPHSVSSPLAERGGLKSPWSRRKRKRVLSTKQWSRLFSTNGRLRDGGAKLLKRVRSGGVEPAIRSEVWPFLLGVYDLNSSESERNVTKAKNRKEYEKLRRHCRLLAHQRNSRNGLTSADELGPEEFNCNGVIEIPPSPVSQEVNPCSYFQFEDMKQLDVIEEEEDKSDTESSDSESSDEEDSDNIPLPSVTTEEEPKFTRTASVRGDFSSSSRTTEDFSTWQRIIRLDALRTCPEWVLHSLKQAEVSEDEALQAACDVGLKDYDNLDPCIVYHAARLVAILEAYAVYDAETGYCQGMSDLLSPIIAIMEDDSVAFWCFVGFMRKARHNFRLDEAGIRRQLKIVSRIIQCKDSHLYKHLEKLQAEDCFFVYRMVVVLFRRELTFEQTVCLWEVMWADQAAVRAGIGLSAWARIRLRAPPTDDLLLYAIAACVLQKRKLIIEKYSSMDEILTECNSIDGQLDVWRLLDDAHDLVVNLHDKI